jgi:hypothetical protein
MHQHCNQFISLQIIETSVESDEEYEIEHFKKRKWLMKKFTILSNEKIMISQKTSESLKNFKNYVRTL